MKKMIKKIHPEKMDVSYDTIYKYNGIPVPRVTHILSSMIHEDYLMSWANYIGIRGQRYKETLDLAARKGSYTHDAIENYIQNGVELDMKTVSGDCRDAVDNSYNSFLKWWSVIEQNEYEVIMQEYPLVGPWFAGTLDLLIKINGKIYLMDFKTSNHPSFKYFLQLAAYRYLLKELYNIIIDGCGIIMLNKECIDFKEIILNDINDTKSYNHSYMKYCEETFFALTYSYYMRLQTEYMFKEVMKKNEQ